MKTRLLVVTNLFHPDRGGGASVFSDLCYGLAQRGFDVTVRTTYPYYPEWKDKTGCNGLRVDTTESQGVRVERYGLFIPGRPNSLIHRLLYEGTFCLSLARSLLRHNRFDAMMVYVPMMGAVAYGFLHQLIFRTPFWLNVQDLPADAASAVGISKAGLVDQVLSRVQTFMFNRADVWSSISPAMVAGLKKSRRHDQPVLFLPNYLNRSMGQHIADLGTKEGRPPSTPIKLLYAGNIGAKQDLLAFCQAMCKSDAAFEFRVHGDGSKASHVQQWISDRDDSRFQFGPFLDEAGFAGALHEADFFVITEKSGSQHSFIPSKLVPGLASGTPTLAVCDEQSPLGREITEARCGLRFSWADLDRIPPSLAAVTRDGHHQYTAWQSAAIKRSYLYSRERLVDEFAKSLSVMSTKRQPRESDFHPETSVDSGVGQ